MDIFIIVVFILLTIANAFFYIRLRAANHVPQERSLMTVYLPFFVFMVCVLLFRLPVPWYALLLGMAAQFMQTYFGYYRNAFARSMKFDRYMHVFGSFAYALLVYHTLFTLIGGAITRLYAALFVGAIGISLGVLIEISEFLTDLWSKTPVKHQKTLKDTDIDLICNVIGSVFAAVFAYFALVSNSPA